MNRRPLRLLWFNLVTDADAPNLGFTSEWINAVAPHCESIDVITMRAGRLELAPNVQVRSLGKELGLGEARRAARFYSALWSLLRGKRYDACFAHMQPLFAAMGAPLLRLHGIPLVLWYTHRSVTVRLRLAEWAATRVVTASAESFRLRSSKLKIIGHGIDTGRFRPAARPDPQAIVLSSGRLAPVKRLETLVSAMALLRDQDQACRLRLVGEAYPQDRGYEQKLRDQVASLGLQDCVEFAGRVARTEVPGELQRAQVVVNLSETGSLDKAVLEAMACSVPVVTSNEAFYPLLDPWRSQLLVAPDDPQGLAQRISSLLAMDGERRASLGRELRDLVLREHSLQHLVENLLAVLRAEMAPE